MEASHVKRGKKAWRLISVGLGKQDMYLVMQAYQAVISTELSTKRVDKTKQFRLKCKQ
jgi:hypothetical protein